MPGNSSYLQPIKSYEVSLNVNCSGASSVSAHAHDDKVTLVMPGSGFFTIKLGIEVPLYRSSGAVNFISNYLDSFISQIEPMKNNEVKLSLYRVSVDHHSTTSTGLKPEKVMEHRLKLSSPFLTRYHHYVPLDTIGTIAIC